MNKTILFLGFGFLLSACNGAAGIGTSSQAVVLDVRCAADGECPSGFQCETEVEHGTAASYCVSDDDRGTSTGACPPGYELEVEHAAVFCKPHGGDDDGGDDTSSGEGAGAACATSADCAPGYECETEIEHGVTTSFCKAHGG